MYYELSDLLLRELPDRFNKNPILHAANGQIDEKEIDALESSCYANGFDGLVSQRHWPFLADAMKELDLPLQKITRVHTARDAMMCIVPTSRFFLHKLLGLYLTIPVTTSIAEQLYEPISNMHPINHD